MMEETQQQRSLFGFLQSFIYVFICIDIYVQTLSFSYNHNTIVHNLNQFLYKLPVFHNALTSQHKLKKDVWNVEEESFPQNKKLVRSPFSFNLPMSYYHKRKINQGWINVNPFRGMLVLGVSGSGKSESVIIPFIFLALGMGLMFLLNWNNKHTYFTGRVVKIIAFF